MYNLHRLQSYTKRVTITILKNIMMFKMHEHRYQIYGTVDKITKIKRIVYIFFNDKVFNLICS